MARRLITAASSGIFLVFVHCQLQLDHKFYRTKITPDRIAKMEALVKEDPSMACDEWFAAVCAIDHEKRVENVTNVSKKKGWSMEEMCIEFNKIRGYFWSCYNRASHRCGQDIGGEEVRWFETWADWHMIPDMAKIFDGALDTPQAIWMTCRDMIPLGDDD